MGGYYWTILNRIEFWSAPEHFWDPRDFRSLFFFKTIFVHCNYNHQGVVHCKLFSRRDKWWGAIWIGSLEFLEESMTNNNNNNNNQQLPLDNINSHGFFRMFPFQGKPLGVWSNAVFAGAAPSPRFFVRESGPQNGRNIPVKNLYIDCPGIYGVILPFVIVLYISLLESLSNSQFSMESNKDSFS